MALWRFMEPWIMGQLATAFSLRSRQPSTVAMATVLVSWMEMLSSVWGEDDGFWWNCIFEYKSNTVFSDELKLSAFGSQVMNCDMNYLEVFRNVVLKVRNGFEAWWIYPLVQGMLSPVAAWKERSAQRIFGIHCFLLLRLDTKWQHVLTL